MWYMSHAPVSALPLAPVVASLVKPDSWATISVCVCLSPMESPRPGWLIRNLGQEECRRRDEWFAKRLTTTLCHLQTTVSFTFEILKKLNAGQIDAATYEPYLENNMEVIYAAATSCRFWTHVDYVSRDWLMDMWCYAPDCRGECLPDLSQWLIDETRQLVRRRDNNPTSIEARREALRQMEIAWSEDSNSRWCSHETPGAMIPFFALSIPQPEG